MTNTFLANNTPSSPSADHVDSCIPAEPQATGRRGGSCIGLSQVLADTYVLYSKTHGFHWNVTGPMFTSLHALFMEQYIDLFEAMDLVAERIRVLNQEAPFGPGALTCLSAIKDATGRSTAMAMVRELEADHSLLAARCRTALVLAREDADEGSADLLTQRLRVHEKTAWKLASILH